MEITSSTREGLLWELPGEKAGAGSARWCKGTCVFAERWCISSACHQVGGIVTVHSHVSFDIGCGPGQTQF